MEVIVGEHGGAAIAAPGPRYPELEQHFGEPEIKRRRHLEVGRGADQYPPPSPRSASPHRSPRRLARPRRAPCEGRSVRKTWGVWAPQSDGPLHHVSPRGRTLRRPSCRADLLDRVRDGRGGDGPSGFGVLPEGGDEILDQLGVTSGRAASWTATSSVPTAAIAFDTASALVPAADDHAEIAASQIVDVAGRCCDNACAPTPPRERPRSTTPPSVSRPAAGRPSGRRLRAGLRSRRPR